MDNYRNSISNVNITSNNVNIVSVDILIAVVIVMVMVMVMVMVTTTTTTTMRRVNHLILTKSLHSYTPYITTAYILLVRGDHCVGDWMLACLSSLT